MGAGLVVVVVVVVLLLLWRGKECVRERGLGWDKGVDHLVGRMPGGSREQQGWAWWGGGDVPRAWGIF